MKFLFIDESKKQKDKNNKYFFAFATNSSYAIKLTNLDGFYDKENFHTF